MKSSEEQYIEWLDIAKGIGMLLVIMGHCFNKDTYIHNWIFSFHMPLFFFLSGVCFREDKYSNLIYMTKSKGKRLLIPYVEFGVLGLLISAFIAEWRKEITVSGLLTDIYTGYPSLSHITSIWYLVSLFLCFVIWWIVCRFKSVSVRLFFVFISAGIGEIINYLHLKHDNTIIAADSKSLTSLLPGGRLPLTLDTCFTAFVFVALGSVLAMGVYNLKSSMLWAISLLAINVVVSIALNTRVNLHGCLEGNIIYFYIAAFSGIIGTIMISHCWSEKDAFRRIKQMTIYIGKHSLIMMGFQSLFINLCVFVINRMNRMTYVIYESVPPIYGVICFGIVLLLCFLVCLGYDVIKEKWSVYWEKNI